MQDQERLARAALAELKPDELVPWLPPPWLIILWAQFATTFHFSMRWLKCRPGLAAVFGAVGGPLAFLAGQRLGVVEFHPSFWPSMVSLAAVWAAAMPLLMRLAARQDGREGCGVYRVDLPVWAWAKAQRNAVRSAEILNSKPEPNPKRQTTTSAQ